MSTINTNTCNSCGAANVSLYELDEQLLCLDCLRDAGYSVCEECGEVVRTDTLTEVCNGGHVCEECLDNYYCSCDDCGEYVPRDDIESVDSDTYYESYVCSDCLNNASDYFYCENCGTWHTYRRSRSYDVVNFGTVCQSCLENGDFAECNDCGNIYRTWDMTWDDDTGEYFCDSCQQSRRSSVFDRHVMHSHDFKPVPKPRSRKNIGETAECKDVPELLFGCELEVDKGPYENRERAISDIADASEDVYIKRDGSLEHGFEIVTYPCTLEYHQYAFKWRHITSIASKAGFKSHDARTCGLHVHVGVYQLGEDETARRKTIANAVLLVDRHWDAVVQFSRRRDDQLRWARRPQIDRPMNGDTEARVIDKAWAAHNTNRYQAVNLENAGTIEFRIFNGTLKRDTIIATLQFLSNLCTYAKTHSVAECLASTWADIVHLKEYDELNNYLAERNLTEVTSPVAVVLGEGGRTSTPDTCNDHDFRVGDSVRPNPGAENFFYGDVGVGTVIQVSGPEIGVQFPGWQYGHSLGGRLSFEHRYEGWYFRPENLTHVA